jgi:1-deoxy-D-xylulose-5-phosphate reductoisomerase
LFDLPFDAIDVVVHPQSIVHSMVEFIDGSTMAQVSPPDMRLPIALGLTWPDRLPDAAPANDWTRPVSWDFAPLDHDAFPAVQLAKRAGSDGGTAPAIFNAANEVCVDAFLGGRLPFVGIVDTVAAALDRHRGDNASRSATADADALTLEEVLAADAQAREIAEALIAQGHVATAGAAR